MTTANQSLPLLPSHPEHSYIFTDDEKRVIEAYGDARAAHARKATLLDAMNATRAFGKTGEVMAKVIGALK